VPTTLKQCLTIAGSDSGGGAGIQADLKAFQANGVFGMSAITSITAQNTQRVARAYDLPVDLVLAQLDAVFEDFEVAGLKTGMLSSPEIVEAVAGYLRGLPARPPIVVDPVMVSKSGYPLLVEDAVGRVKTDLLPLATVVTPNRREAELLSGVKIESRSSLKEVGRRILDLGPGAVLLKGGHLEEDLAVDYLFEPGAVRSFSALRIDTDTTHGTGCTLSAALCANLACGIGLHDAVERAKDYVTEAIRHGLRIGHGHGPTHHFYFLRPLVP
jgi:hydroxymethylpyrimidine/phosphomethylpyrimidine kinase